MDIVTVNLGNKAHNVTALQRRLQMGRLARAKPAVIVTQEARSGGWVTPTGYRVMPAFLPGSGEDRIVVRKSVRVLGHGYLQMHPGRAHAWPARHMPYVVIDRGSARPLWVIDVHLNSGIEAGGAFVATGERAVFTRHHIETVADWARFVDKRMHADCLVLGDTNVDAYADRRIREPEFPTRQFGAAGLREALPVNRSGTLGNRRVDRVFHSPTLGVSVTDLARRKPYDHQPVSVKVR